MNKGLIWKMENFFPVCDIKPYFKSLKIYFYTFEIKNVWNHSIV